LEGRFATFPSYSYDSEFKILASEISYTETHQPHPAAPKEVVEAFESIFSRHSSQSSSAGGRGGSGNGHDNVGKDVGGKTIDITGGAKSARPTKSISFDQFWEAPERIWRPKRMEMSDSEVETVMVRLGFFLD